MALRLARLKDLIVVVSGVYLFAAHTALRVIMGLLVMGDRCW